MRKCTVSGRILEGGLVIRFVVISNFGSVNQAVYLLPSTLLLHSDRVAAKLEDKVVL